MSMFGSIVAQREALPLLHASCTRHLHVVKELMHKKTDWYKCCSSFSWFCSSLCFGYQIRNYIQALTHEQRSLSHIPKCTPFYHAHIVQEQSWVSIPHYIYRTVTSVWFRLGVMQTLQLMSPEIISHIMKKGSLDKVQPPHRAIIPLRHKLLFPKLRQNWNDSPQSCSIKM